MLDSSVKYFTSTMTGAPTVSGSVGALISILDGCLVNGFGSVTLTSLVVASDVATATVSGGHNFPMIGVTGAVVLIEGATPAELNGEARIVSVPNTTTFTFATIGVDDQTATGTITAKRAPARWTKAYSGTNLAAYRMAAGGTQFYLRVDDTIAAYARVIGYETMSDVNTGTYPFPTEAQSSGGFYAPKYYFSNSTPQPWTIIADPYAFMVLIGADSTGNDYGFFFGDIVSDYIADPYKALLIAGTDTSTGSAQQIPVYGSTAGTVMARSYTGAGSSITALKYGHQRQATTGMGSAGATYPHPGHNGFLAGEVGVWESTAIMRGKLPGIYSPLHAAAQLTSYQTVETADGKTLVVNRIGQGGSANSACALDITGPWR